MSSIVTVVAICNRLPVRPIPGAKPWLALPLSTYVDPPVFGDDGAVIHTRGVTAAPGLYFLGMPWQHTRGSALLGWVKDDAQHVADQISKLATVRVDTPDDQRPLMAAA